MFNDPNEVFRRPGDVDDAIQAEVNLYLYQTVANMFGQQTMHGNGCIVDLERDENATDALFPFSAAEFTLTGGSVYSFLAAEDMLNAFQKTGFIQEYSFPENGVAFRNEAKYAQLAPGVELIARDDEPHNMMLRFTPAPTPHQLMNAFGAAIHDRVRTNMPESVRGTENEEIVMKIVTRTLSDALKSQHRELKR